MIDAYEKMKKKRESALLNFMSCMMEEFARMHNEDIPGSPFKIDDKVKFIQNSNGERAKYGTFVITGVNYIEQNVWEYSLKDQPFLVYGNEIEKVEE